MPRLDKLRELLISYTGLNLQDPEMFPQPSGCVCHTRPTRMLIHLRRKALGAPELLPAFLSLSSLTSPPFAPSSSVEVFAPADLVDLFTDLSARFLGDGLEDIVAPLLRLLCFHESLQRPEGLGGGDAAWRAVVAGLECLVGVKGVATVITRVEEWCPEDADAADLERRSLMGPLLRLGVFNREWVCAYSSDPCLLC